MKSVHCYILRCVTNLHVGGEGESYAIIDKPVQRDGNSQYPTIHGSGIKGALRQYCEGETFEIPVFGSKPKDNTHQEGSYAFHDALLLALPVPSNIRHHYNAICHDSITAFIDACADFGVIDEKNNDIIEIFDKLQALSNDVQEHGNAIVLNENTNETIILDHKTATNNTSIAKETIEKIASFIGKNIAIVSNKDFLDFAKSLPVTTRNYLENGESANLWNEEYVPADARFFTFIERKNNDNETVFASKLSEKIQLGGNATVGYGQTKFLKF
jgi:CRISPR-associated protein Cmr4